MHGFVFRNLIKRETSCGRIKTRTRTRARTRTTTRTRIKNKLLHKERRQECGIDRGVFYRTIRLRIPDAKGWLDC